MANPIDSLGLRIFTAGGTEFRFLQRPSLARSRYVAVPYLRRPLKSSYFDIFPRITGP